jgi:hypothetical protein
MSKKTKVYIAGIAGITGTHTSTIEKLGYGIKYKWVAPDPFATKDQQREYSQLILRGVRDSDLIIIGETDTNSWVILGACIGLGKKIWFVANKSVKNLFIRYPTVVRFKYWSDVYNELSYFG